MKKKFKKIATWFTVFVFAFQAVMVLPAHAIATFPQLVSVATDGTQANSFSQAPSISADGRYVVFESYASNFAPGGAADCPGGCSDVFIRDRQTGETNRINITIDGFTSNGSSHTPSISADGRYVVFRYGGSIVVEDRQTGIQSFADVSSNGVRGNNTSEKNPVISADGRYIAFLSRSSNLVSGDTGNYYDIFVHDQQTGVTSRVSVSSNGTQANNDSSDFSIGADGRYIVFRSSATNLVNDSIGAGLFVHDSQTGETSRMGGLSPGGEPVISEDGNKIAYTACVVTGYPPEGGTTGTCDIDVYNRLVGSITRVSNSYDGNNSNGFSLRPSISADGRYVSFGSWATNLVSGDTNEQADIFVHDIQTNITSRVSVSAYGGQGDGDSGYYASTISADGNYVAFVSGASNLVSGDINNTYDIFVTQNPSIVDPTMDHIDVAPVNLWLGLQNKNDQNAKFDIRTELYLNGNLISFGQNNCVGDLTKDNHIGKEISIPLSDPAPGAVINTGDNLSLKVVARVGTNGQGSICGDIINTSGLRLYYDNVNNPSGFGVGMNFDTITDYFLAFTRGDLLLTDESPTGSLHRVDSLSLSFSNNNPWVEVGVWGVQL